MATVTKKDKFFEVLRNIFVGAKIEGNSGYVNLMKIKSKYYNEFKEQLHTDIDAKLKEVGQNFEEELYNKLFTFFKKYFSESGSIYFSYTPLQEKVYERIYRDDKDVMLFWKTHMLYYVKTERLFKNMEVEDEDIIYLFDVAELEHKKNNEKKELVYEFVKAEHTDKRRVSFSVKYSANGSKTKTEEILKKIKKEKAFGSLTLKQIEKAFGIFKRQSEIDYFINKNAKQFLREQFSFWIKGYLVDDETLFESARLKQFKALQNIAFNIIDLVSQFEDELVKIWNKPKFAHSSNYIITLDKIAERDFSLLEKTIKHKKIAEQIKEWQVLTVVSDKFKIEDIFETDLHGKKLKSQWQYLPIDTKHFKDLEFDILSLFDDLDNKLDGFLINSENYQALNTIKGKFSNKVQTVYIDPPFNLGTNPDYEYLVNYKDSSWLSILENRVSVSKQLLKNECVYYVRCDANGNMLVRLLLDNLFGSNTFRNDLIVQRGRNQVGSPNKLETISDTLFLYSLSDKPLNKIQVKRSIADIKWTGFTLGGDRNPPERNFIGKTIFPLKGQHFTLIQPKVDKLLNEKYLRLRCKKCNGLHFQAKDDADLANYMKKKENRFKFYDITNETDFVGLSELKKCNFCGEKEDFAVQYLGSEDKFVNSLWIDIAGYANTTGFTTENAEELISRAIQVGSIVDGYILDYFLGSGTTTATAHKLRKKYIGIEQGSQYYEYALPRMKKVLAGIQEGISKELKQFKGGGFF
ncbi:MAG TPA: site-specific DNA-methyltransferase, partial [Chitinophagales bacterium]|nr:site-specific DNA-methyltransferase [Chitinophagales bacterium]